MKMIKLDNNTENISIISSIAILILYHLLFDFQKIYFIDGYKLYVLAYSIILLCIFYYKKIINFIM